MKIKNVMFCVSAVISLIFIASPVSAIHLNDGQLIADCEEYCIQVEGSAYTGDPCKIDYELTFDPAIPSGSLEASFTIPPVVSDLEWDVFDYTNCEVFDDIPCGEYTITVEATLICESDPEDTPSITKSDDIVCPCEEEGCTPGFWKNHPDCWCAEYQPETLIKDVWVIPDELLEKLGENTTLMMAMKYGGGKGVKGAAKILLRAATASLQNACNGDVSFALSVEEVITGGNAALATMDRKQILKLASTLDDLNNSGCPINAHCEAEDQDD